MQIVGHYYTGASQPQTKVTAGEKRDFYSRQPHSHVSHHNRHHQAGIQPSETFDLRGRHGQTTTTTKAKDRSYLHEQAGYDPERYGSSSQSRHVGAEQFPTREPQQQHHHQSRSSHLDPQFNSSKKHKQKGERGVRFHQ